MALAKKKAVKKKTGKKKAPKQSQFFVINEDKLLEDVIQEMGLLRGNEVQEFLRSQLELELASALEGVFETKKGQELLQGALLKAVEENLDKMVKDYMKHVYLASDV